MTVKKKGKRFPGTVFNYETGMLHGCPDAWKNMPVKDRVTFCKARGLVGRTGSKDYIKLSVHEWRMIFKGESYK